MSVEKKYVCFGVHVRSICDGQIHHIPAHRLPKLYGVNPTECVFVTTQTWGQTMVGGRCDHLIRLYPDESGDYKLSEIRSDRDV